MLVGSITHLNELQEVSLLADLIELRLDYFEIEKKPPFPCIFTLRKKEQGGVGHLSEEERLKKIEKYLQLAPEYCDIETDTDPAWIERISKQFPKVKLIGSYHNFKETPLDLDGLLQKMKNPCFSIYKIALKANSTADMLRLMIFARSTKEPLAAISMGEYGAPSRVIGPVVGNVLDYAGLQDDPQLSRYSLTTMLEAFHYRRLNQDTRLYALIGYPVEQSPGDLFHNGCFRHNAVYVKMSLSGEEVPDFFKLIRKLPFGGLSVTTPIKEVVYREMDEVSQAAKAIGAVNTVFFDHGRMVGTNTDAPGALNAIEKHLKVEGKLLSILGAGGTARAIAYEAKRRGAVVSIFNRTPSRAKELADALGCQGYGLDEFSFHPYDLLVNTIPPKGGEIVPLRAHTTVMDVVYYPKETPLLIEAKKRDCLCIYGEEMFIEQALLQQKEWAVLSD